MIGSLIINIVMITVKSLQFLTGLVFVFSLTACVDTIPFGSDNEPGKKLFIECELIPGKNIEAFVSYPTFLNQGIDNIPPLDTNEIDLTLSDMTRGITTNFVFDTKLKRYVVDQTSFPVRSGHVYMLRGTLRGAEGEISVSTEPPAVFPYDSLVVTSAQFTPFDGGNWSSVITMRLYYNNQKMVTDKYTHVSFYEKKSGKHMSCVPLSQQQNCSILSHRDGLLWFVDQSSGFSFMDFRMIHVADQKVDVVEMVLKNTTESYYQYQKFKSNAPATPTPVGNPSIAAFNIYADAGYGSFSAATEQVILFSIK